MKRVFVLVLVSSVCLGCQSGGSRQPATTISSVPPVSPANNAVADNSNANQAEASPSTSPSAPNSMVSTLGRIWQAVGFAPAATAEPAPTSPEIARFNNFVGAISTQTSQLNISDPPEVTRQKAQGILTTLGDWDSVLAAGRSMGLVNDATAELLTGYVTRLTTETQKLLQFAPQAETINAIKQIGGSLGAVYNNVQGLWSQGASVSQAIWGGGNQQPQ